MMVEALPFVTYNVISSLFHGLLFVAGFILIKHAKNWLSVLGTALALITTTILLTFGTFFFHGPERAWSMIAPGGELFVVSGMPVIISAVISTMTILFSAYILFVEPGNRKNV